MNVKKLLTCNFDYHVSRLGCECNSICRCSTIENPSLEYAIISSYNMERLKEKHGIIDAYCIERIIKKQILDSTYDISPIISNGYYGEEISGWSHSNEMTASRKIDELLEECSSDTEKIRMVLMDEYQYIPEHILECDTVSVKTHDVNEIRKLNFSGMVKNYQYETSIYTDHIPIAILNNQRNIVDGYHRIANCDSDTAMFIELSR